ncbi:MAG TPA: hypothetical protein VN181_09790, partial [Thermoanaerobaculia bacterium]|nr:hypothetical protein [Thermoanaerobaculia bacterium]
MRYAWQWFAALLFTTTSVFAVFEPNRGQAGGDVRFLGREKGSVILAGDGGWNVTLRAQATIRFRIADAPNAKPEAAQPLESHSNYFIGNDASRWLRDVPHYDSIRYRDVYPGIDAVIHPFEYDFIIAPGADPDQIGVIVDGAEPKFRGDAIVAGDLVQKKPVAYQERGGVRHDVDVRYALDGH